MKLLKGLTWAWKTSQNLRDPQKPHSNWKNLHRTQEDPAQNPRGPHRTWRNFRETSRTLITLANPGIMANLSEPSRNSAKPNTPERTFANFTVTFRTIAKLSESYRTLAQLSDTLSEPCLANPSKPQRTLLGEPQRPISEPQRTFANLCSSLPHRTIPNVSQLEWTLANLNEL